MVYNSNHSVIIPNFRNLDETNPYQERFTFCEIANDNVISFEQGEIDEFVKERTQRRVGLEDLMTGGQYNVTPFRRNDSLVPILYAGLMLGEGCMTREERRKCLDVGDNDKVARFEDLFSKHISIQNKKFRESFLSQKQTLLILGNRETARESSYRSINLKGAPDELEINPTTRLLRYANKISLIPKDSTEVLCELEQNPSLKLSSSKKAQLSGLNCEIRKLCGMRVLRRNSETYTFRN